MTARAFRCGVSAYRAWAYIVYSCCKGLSGTSKWRISKMIRLHAFFMSVPNLFYYFITPPAKSEPFGLKTNTFMENVKFTVADIENEKKKWANNMLQDKLAEKSKWGVGHIIEFSIQDDILTIRTTKKTFTAPINDVVVTYVVNNFVTTYTFKNTGGEKITFSSTMTYLDPDDMGKIEDVIEQMPGYKGRNTADKILLYILGVVLVLSIIWASL